MHLGGELNFCNHHRAQPTAQIDCPQPSLTSHLLCPLLQVSSVVNNIIASLNNGSSFGNETSTANAPAPATDDAKDGSEALGCGNNAATSPLAAALSGQTSQILISAPDLTTMS